MVESFSFLDDGRLASMKRTKGAGATLKDQTYEYDRNGNRTSDERGAHLFNARGQLVRWTRGAGQSKSAGTTVSYSLNGSGAMTRREDSASGRVETYEYVGTSDRLRSVTASEPDAQPSTATYHYDLDGFGNVTQIVQPGQDTSYAYDAFGRMTGSDGPGTGDEGTVSYDGLDRRDSKAEAGEALDYAYIGLSEKLSREQTPVGKVRSYEYDSALRRLGQRTSLSGVSLGYRSFAYDANGSVEGLEGSDGELLATDRYRYDPYGELQDGEGALSPPARENPFRFEGFYYDAAVKTYDMQARPYRPDIGRFLVQDRFESASGDFALQASPLLNNRYTFAAANPVSNIEFDGHYAGNEGGAQRAMQGSKTPRGQRRVRERESAIPGRTGASNAFYRRPAHGGFPVTTTADHHFTELRARLPRLPEPKAEERLSGYRPYTGSQLPGQYGAATWGYPGERYAGGSTPTPFELALEVASMWPSRIALRAGWHGVKAAGEWVASSFRRRGGARRIDDATKAPRIAGGAPIRPTDLQRTESLRGNASSRKVREIAESMRQHGWQGDPVEVFFHGGQPYLVNGHHRVAAAMRAGIDDIPYREISQAELRGYGYGSPDDLIGAWANRGPDRLR